MRNFCILAIMAISVIVMSCDNGYDNPNNGCVENTTHLPRIAVGTAVSDFTSANLEILSAGGCIIGQNLLSQLHTDHSIKTYKNDIYILERFGKDNVIKYDGKNMAAVYQENLGSGLNIQDIIIVSETKAYISCHLSSGLIVFDPKAGKRVSTIDLSRFNTYAGTDSAETQPFVSALAFYNGHVYAACQRLKTVQTSYGATFEPADISLIAIIDTHTDAVAGSIALHKKNPASMDILYDGKMLVSSTGFWYDGSSGGVELIDLAQNSNLGIVADGSLFGGSLSTVIFVSPEKAYVSVGKMSDDFTQYWTEIIPLNLITGKAGAKIAGIGDGFGGLAYDGAYLYVGDRGLGSAGVAMIDPATDNVWQKMGTGMPPAAMAVFFIE